MMRIIDKWECEANGSICYRVNDGNRDGHYGPYYIYAIEKTRSVLSELQSYLTLMKTT